MAEREGTFLENFSMTFAANALGFIVSALTSLFIPQLLGPEAYGYWQLYLLYNGYMLYFSFGLTDGIQVRYGGRKFETIDPSVISGQFWLLFGLNTILNLSIVAIFFQTAPEEGKALAMVFAALAGVVAVTRSLITMLLQATNRMKVAATSVMIERLLFVLVILLILFVPMLMGEGLGELQYFHVMAADFAGKLVSFFYVIWQNKKLVFSKPPEVKEVFHEARLNMSVGLRIVLAALGIVFGIGFLRQAIEARWGIETFAQVSISLSLASMFMLFVNALSVVLFPALRRQDPQTLPSLYAELETLTVMVLSFLLIFYEPFRLILRYFLPSYEQGLIYMGLLFPIFLFDGKMSLLITTYLKALNRPTQLLISNALSFALSLILSFLITRGILPLTGAILGILGVQMIRTIAGELFLGFAKPWKAIGRELTLTISFILLTHYLGGFKAPLAYLPIYLVFLYFARQDLKGVIQRLKGAKK